MSTIAGIISADIISSTSIRVEEKYLLLDRIHELSHRLEKKYKTYLRILKGDLIEIYIPDAKDTLRIGLILKFYIKSELKKLIPDSAGPHITIEKKRSSYLKAYGIRIAIVVDKMELINTKKGILEGPAIYKAGRMINEFHTYTQKRIVIKNSMYFLSSYKDLQDEFEVIVSLLDVMIKQATGSQCEVIFHKLFGDNEERISKIMNIAQSNVNIKSNAVGWHAIEKSIQLFENKLNSKVG